MDEEARPRIASASVATLVAPLPALSSSPRFSKPVFSLSNLVSKGR